MHDYRDIYYYLFVSEYGKLYVGFGRLTGMRSILRKSIFNVHCSALVLKENTVVEFVLCDQLSKTKRLPCA